MVYQMKLDVFVKTGAFGMAKEGVLMRIKTTGSTDFLPYFATTVK